MVNVRYSIVKVVMGYINTKVKEAVYRIKSIVYDSMSVIQINLYKHILHKNIYFVGNDIQFGYWKHYGLGL